MNIPESQTAESIKHAPAPLGTGPGGSPATPATLIAPAQGTAASISPEPALAAPTAPNAAEVHERASGAVFLDPIKWPKKAQFLHLLWEKPATHIAADLGCCQASVLIRAKELDLPRPGHGYWQKKKVGLEVPVREDVKILMAKLDAGGFAEPTSGPDSRRLKSPRRRRPGFQMSIAWPSKAQFLRLLWTKPSVQIAHDLGCNIGTVLTHTKTLGLPTPGNRYWQKKRAGHDVDIPADVIALMAALDAEK